MKYMCSDVDIVQWITHTTMDEAETEDQNTSYLSLEAEQTVPLTDNYSYRWLYCFLLFTD